MIVYSEKYLGHNQEYHPENNQRLKAIMNHLTREDVFEKVPLLEPYAAREEDILRVHTRDYYQQMESLSLEGEGMLDADTYLTEDSFSVALLAAGGLMTCVDKAFEGYDFSFALIRPPGHHATQDKAMGFCIFNNVAVGASYAIKKYNLDRVFILDYDVHHGNGTQDIFYSDPKVCYLSLHQHPFYPGTGSAEEVGDGKGEGYTVNIPLPPMICDESYLRAFREIAVPILEQFEPQLIIVSAGYDSHHDDPLGGMKLSTKCYYEISNKLRETNCKVIFALEGGYNLKVLPASVYATIAPLFHLPVGLEETIEEDKRITDYVDSKIAAYKRELSRYWSF
ncbi:MAG: histone deacetylase [Candidatus Hydrothermarchaeales archaeon]